MEKFEIKFIGNVINTKTNNRIRIEKLVEVNEKDYFEANKVSKLSVQYQKEYLNRVIPYYFPNCTPVSDENMSFKTFKKGSKNEDIGDFVTGAVVGYVAGKSEQKRTKKEVQHEPEIISQDSLPYSFSQKLSVFDGLNFENCDEERTKINLKYIYDNISEYEWGDSKNDSSGIITENNRSLNICVGKFEEGLERLKKISSNDNEILYYNKLYNKLIKKRKANEPWSFAKKFFIFLLLFLLGLFLLAIS